MKTILFKFFIVAGVLCMLLSFDLPSKWYPVGDTDSYDMGLAKGAGPDGSDCGTVQSKHSKTSKESMGTLMQDCSATNYAGKRVRMTGYMKGENVKKWASFWLRADAADGSHLAFD